MKRKVIKYDIEYISKDTLKKVDEYFNDTRIIKNEIKRKSDIKTSAEQKYSTLDILTTIGVMFGTAGKVAVETLKTASLAL
jgi:hypothetical protein